MGTLRGSRIAGWLFALAMMAGWSGWAGAGTVTVTVGATTGPWDFVAGGLNTAYQYGVHDFTPPTILSAANGFDFTPGGTFTIQYVSGLTNPFGGTPVFDANGDTNYNASNNPGTSGKFFPSLYINPAEYPAYLNALMGTFADSSGSIVGTPFKVGDLLSEVVPIGATRLQLGVNDDIFSDNTGALVISVTGPSAVPEPSSMMLSATGTLVLLGYVLWHRRRRVFDGEASRR